MASRRELKARAREHRMEQERQEKLASIRRRRLYFLGGILGAVIVVLVIGIRASNSGDGTSKLTHNFSAVKAVTAALNGIPQRGETLGNPKARVTVTAYEDLQCPVCASLNSGSKLGTVTGGLPQFVSQQVKTGKFKVVYKSLCTATCNDYPTNGKEQFIQQQEAAYAAGLQNKFWDFADIMYREQGQEGSHYMTRAYLEDIAREIPGFNYLQWNRDRSSAPLAQEVSSDETQGEYAGVSKTPTLVVSGPGGTLTLPGGSQPYSSIETAVGRVA